jgi:hypothetical protein
MTKNPGKDNDRIVGRMQKDTAAEKNLRSRSVLAW